MKQLDLTLLADGTSDEVLLRIIEWVYHKYSTIPLNAQFARYLPPISHGLNARILRAIELYPCDILVVHRDAENASPATRGEEILEACRNTFDRFVPIVPVRMTEAWLLGSESAIRRAAENGNGNGVLNIPPKRQWEAIPDPKRTLHDLLRTASSLSNRRLKGLSIGRWVARTAVFIDDWSYLQGLSSFDSFEAKFCQKLNDIFRD